MEQITHAELCKATAKRFLKGKRVALYEYKSTASSDEEPDVLIFGTDDTHLFEIKMSRSDFKADAGKRARVRMTAPSLTYLGYQIREMRERIRTGEVRADKKRTYQLEKIARQYYHSVNEYRIELPHLGTARSYVCPYGLIQVEDVPEGWGLIWFKGGKFYVQRESAKFRTNMRVERNLLSHAIRRMASGDPTGIMVSTYSLT